MVNQQNWRTIGLVLLAISIAMAIAGVHMEGLRAWLRTSPWVFIAYWGGLLIPLCGAVYIAFLDMRFIKADYATAKRDAFLQTLGDGDFRKHLTKKGSSGGKDTPPKTEDI